MDFEFRVDGEEEGAEAAEAAFAEVQAVRPDGGETVEAEAHAAAGEHREAAVGDEVAEGLDVPGVKVVVRLDGVEVAVAALFFVGHAEEEEAAGFEEAAHFRKFVRGVQRVLEGVVAEEGVDGSVGQRAEVADEFDAVRGERGPTDSAMS